MLTSTIEYQDPEAFSEEWEDEQATLKELVKEQQIEQTLAALDDMAKASRERRMRRICGEIKSEIVLFNQVRKELAEAKDGEKKFARLARAYVAPLRGIFWRGRLRKQAQALLEELQLQATVPMSDLDTEWHEDGDEYVEIDSYTKEPERGITVTNPWERDRVEVQEYLRLCEEANDYCLDADPRTMQLLITIATADHYKPPAQTAADIVFYGPSDDARYTQELAELGYGDDTIEAAHRLQYDLAGDDEPVVYLDEIDEAQLNGAVEQMALDGYDHEEVQEIKRLLRGNPVEMGIFKIYTITYRISAKWLAKGLRQQAIKNFWKIHHREPDTEEIKKFERKPTQAEIHSNIWNNRYGQQLDELVHDLGYAFKPASLAVAFLSKEEWEPLADLVPIPNYDTLATFIELFGDTLLDEAFGQLEAPGLEITENGLAFVNHAPKDDPILDDYDPRVDKITREWEEEIIQKQFVENPVDERGSPMIEASQAYARGWFAALASNVSDLKGAGYAAWRWEKSKAGARAYDRVMAEEMIKNTPWKGALRKAMRAFWNAGKIVELRRSGVIVESEANGQRQVVNWHIAAWKIQHSEIYLAAQDKERLKTILCQKGWGQPVLKLL